MRKLIILLALVFLSQSLFAQKTNSIELELVGRRSVYADKIPVTYYLDGSLPLLLSGYGYGANLNYSRKLGNRLQIRVGLGYYKLGVDNVKVGNRDGRFSPRSRGAEYPSEDNIFVVRFDGYPAFQISKYSYQNLNLTTGLDYILPMNKKLDLVVGADFMYLYTFGQQYQIRSSSNGKYKTQNAAYLGSGINLASGINYHLAGNSYIGAKITAPLYISLVSDQTFTEKLPSPTVTWFKGVGLSISFGRYF